jgi:hypothetical protein
MLEEITQRITQRPVLHDWSADAVLFAYVFNFYCDIGHNLDSFLYHIRKEPFHTPEIQDTRDEDYQ